MNQIFYKMCDHVYSIDSLRCILKETLCIYLIDHYISGDKRVYAPIYVSPHSIMVYRDGKRIRPPQHVSIRDLKL